MASKKAEVRRLLHIPLLLCLAGSAFGNIPRTDRAFADRWSLTMELAPGTHQLSVSALHPSGLFTTNANVWFTNNMAGESAQVFRNGGGDITRRVWTSSGVTNRTQILTWDGKRRLCQVTEYDRQRNGYLWIAEYDGLDRLLCTKWYVMTNGYVQIYGIIAQTNRFVYDPQVEFLDLGVYVGPSGKASNPGQMAWKLCGPDLNGRYGGMNGVGGLEATATGFGYFAPTLNDARGNVLGVCDPAHGTITWNPSRPTGYGAVPGYRPLPLGHGGSYAQSAAWRGKWADVTGYIWLGARFYDPVAGMWLSPDPQWNDRDPSYWSYCGGDPINTFDPDGRCVSGASGAANSMLSGLGNLAKDAYFSVSYGLSSLVYGSDQANQWYGQNWQGLKNTVTGTAQTAYDVGAFGSYALISPFDNDAAYNAYGSSMNRLGGAVDAFRGGSDKSTAYQIGYGGFNAAMMLLPLRAGAAGDAGEVGIIGDARATVPGQLTAGVDYEAQRLAALNQSKNTTVFRPTPQQAQSAAFQVIVGQPQYTAGGQLVGTIADSVQGGLLEIKGGFSTLNSGYQLRLQTYNSVVNSIPLTVETTRPVNPTFMNYLQNWGVTVNPPKAP